MREMQNLQITFYLYMLNLYILNNGGREFFYLFSFVRLVGPIFSF